MVNKIEFEVQLKSSIESDQQVSISLTKSLQSIKSLLVTLVAQITLTIDSASVALKAQLTALLAEIKTIQQTIDVSVSTSLMFEESLTFRYTGSASDPCDMKDFKKWQEYVDKARSNRQQWITGASGSMDKANALISKAQALLQTTQ